MTTNASPEYAYAEKKYLAAKTDEERIKALEEMLKYMPKHKSAEAMRANLRTRYKKLVEKQESRKKIGKGGGKSGIKKEEMQAVLIGPAGSGKSSILASLTNAKPIISSLQFTTKMPLIGTMDYRGVKIQLVDMPAVESEYFDTGISNTADTLLIIITSIEDLQKISPFIERAIGEKIIIYNKIDLLDQNEKRKVEARLKSKKYDFLLYSAETKENIEELKERIFKSFGKIRIYTKQPKKPADEEPVIMPPNSTVKDAAEKIFHGLSEKVKEARVTGPSSKFPNQKVGLDHDLKDKDIVEFKT